jgi:hypothetical protein
MFEIQTSQGVRNTQCCLSRWNIAAIAVLCGVALVSCPSGAKGNRWRGSVCSSAWWSSWPWNHANTAFVDSTALLTLTRCGGITARMQNFDWITVCPRLCSTICCSGGLHAGGQLVVEDVGGKTRQLRQHDLESIGRGCVEQGHRRYWSSPIVEI